MATRQDVEKLLNMIMRREEELVKRDYRIKQLEAEVDGYKNQNKAKTYTSEGVSLEEEQNIQQRANRYFRPQY